MTADKPGLSYADSGVNIAAADAFIERIQAAVRGTHGGRVIPATDAFAGLVRPGLEGLQEPLLAACCDGVGTKLLVAMMAQSYRGLGQDLVAMNVNDLLPVGARPLLFLDYIATGKLEAQVLAEIVEGAAAACRESGCVLLGGETAEMPGLYAPGHFDLAGFAVGVVDRAHVPIPESIHAGDVLVALPSSGVHSNGFSLARAALFERGGLDVHHVPEGWPQDLGATLLTPTRLYVRPVLRLMSQVEVKAGAHITGGGLLGRLLKMARPHLALQVDPASYKRPPIFDLIQRCGEVSDQEMARTFNMGLGYVAVISPAAAAALEAHNPDGWLRVGSFVKHSGNPRVDLGYASGEVST